MTTLAPADELSLIRADLSRLKLREQELRKILMDGGEEARRGDWAKAEIVERTVRVFDHRLLPRELRDDPLYWRERAMTEIQCAMLGPIPYPSWQDAVALNPSAASHGDMGAQGALRA